MSRAEIPGFYFDSEKNRYFKITKLGQYSKAVIENATKIDKSVNIDKLTIPKINNYSIIRQFEKKMRFKDDANFYSKLNEINEFRQFISLNNLHKKKRPELISALNVNTSINYDLRLMLYDVENDNLITSSYDKIYISDGDNVRINNSLSSDNVVYTPSRAMNGGISNLKLCHGSDYGSGGGSLLSFIQNSLNVNDDDLMICKLRNNVIFDHERIKVNDVRGGGGGGDLSIANSKMAYTSKTGISVLDFQTVKQYALYKHRSDIMTLDFQKNIIGAGDRNGGIFMIDIRSPYTNGGDLKMVTTIGKNSACCKFQFLPKNTMTNFLVNGTNDFMSLFDMRNTKRALVKYENYHIGDVINNPNVILHDDYILAKDELSNVVKVYDFFSSKPLMQIGGGDHHNVNRIVNMKSLSEICILNTSNEIEYWCV